MMYSTAMIQAWCPWCGDHMGGVGWGMMVGWILIVLLVILAVWAIIRVGLGTDRGPTSGGDGAEAVLREEYARGAIDEETYRRRLEELRRD